MSQLNHSFFQGEESQIKELLNVFKDAILKTGQDTVMLEGKFDSDLKKNLKTKLQKYMKNLVNLDERLSQEKVAAAKAIEDINEAYRNYHNPTTLVSEDEPYTEPEEVEFDENGEPVVQWPPKSWQESDSGAYWLKILNEADFDVFKEQIKKVKANYKKNGADPRIKSLKRLLAQVEEDDVEDDDEMIASVVEAIPIDPYTKKKIRMPVKNVKCGHIYDKNGIDMYIKSTNNPRCPYIGCVNRAPIRPNDVVDDEETRLKIEYLMALENDESESEAE